MKKPKLITFTQILLAAISISYALIANKALTNIIQELNTAPQNLTELAIGLTICLVAIYLLIKVSQQDVKKISIILFFLLVFFVYPISNALSAKGILPPPPDMTLDERYGMGLYEIVRYISLLLIIGFLSASKAAGLYLKNKNALDSKPVSAA
jgi:hypothetical protein